MVTDALRHAPDSLTYLASIHDPHVFRFCAIPQVRPPTVELTCPVWHLDNRSMARVTVWADHGGGHIGGVLQQHQPFSRCRQNEKRSNRDCALTPAPATTAGRGLGCCAEVGWSGRSECGAHGGHAEHAGCVYRIPSLCCPAGRQGGAQNTLQGSFFKCTTECLFNCGSRWMKQTPQQR